MTTRTHTPPRLRALGYTATSDGGGGYEFWRNDERVGRVFSRAALEAWVAPEPAPRCLDLFCGAGGATKGLQQAGYHVTGVDIRPQPHYIGDRFIQGDAMQIDWEGYDLIWASPPCQRYSELTPMDRKASHADLLPVVADRLRAHCTPYIIENVEMAAHLLHAPIKLCGSMFGLDIWRHRYFEIGNVDVFFLTQPCDHSFHPVVISGQGSRIIDGKRAGRIPVPIKRAAMEIDWMNREELSEAIPPAYSRFLAGQIQAVPA